MIAADGRMNFGSPFFNVGNAVDADGTGSTDGFTGARSSSAGLGMSRFDLFITLSLAL